MQQIKHISQFPISEHHIHIECVSVLILVNITIQQDANTNIRLFYTQRIFVLIRRRFINQIILSAKISRYKYNLQSIMCIQLICQLIDCGIITSIHHTYIHTYRAGLLHSLPPLCMYVPMYVTTCSAKIWPCSQQLHKTPYN